MAITVPIITQFDQKGIKLAERRFKQFGKDASKVGDSIRAAILPAAAAVGALAVAGISAVKSASDLTESVNAVKVTFGEASAEILKLSDAAAKSVGLSKKDFNSLAVQFSSFARKISTKSLSTAKVIEKLTTRAADFASVMNIDVPDAAAKFQSALSGEAEPLKKFGINISDAAVKAYALANNIGAVKGKLTDSEKVVARYGLLMEETAKYANDFANTSDSLSNQQKILKAEFENVKSEIGLKLLPIMVKVADWINKKLIPYVKELAEEFGENGLSGAIKKATSDLGDFISKLDGTQGTIFDFAAALGVMYLAFRAFSFIGSITTLVGSFAGVLSSLGGYLGFGFAVSAGVAAGVLGSLLATVAALFGVFRDPYGRAVFLEYILNMAKLIANVFIFIDSLIRDLINLPSNFLNFITPGNFFPTLPNNPNYYDFSYDAGDNVPRSSPRRPSPQNSNPAPSNSEPYIRPMSVRENQNAGVVVNFNGVVTDPVAVGMEIRKLLDSSNRRSGAM
jgi:hypothetical protein